eukprot:13158903-Alexandrium_andersonii.AAC.1
MLGPRVPPRTAAWESERSPSSVGPAVWTRTAPNKRRRQVGSWSGRRSPGSSGATFLAIHTRISRDRPRTWSILA